MSEVASAIYLKSFSDFINTHFLSLGAPAVHTSVVRLYTSITHIMWLISPTATEVLGAREGKTCFWHRDPAKTLKR